MAKEKKIFVTYRTKPSNYVCRLTGAKAKYYAIECVDEKEALEIASDINSLDGVSYLKINKSGRIRKDAIRSNAETYLTDYIMHV